MANLVHRQWEWHDGCWRRSVAVSLVFSDACVLLSYLDSLSLTRFFTWMKAWTQQIFCILYCSEFCDVVSKIHIYTQEEVEKMSIGIFGDDTQSCLEEAAAVADVSKSSSVSPPDSSPTVVRVWTDICMYCISVLEGAPHRKNLWFPFSMLCYAMVCLDQSSFSAI